MADPWKEIDELAARHRVDLERARVAVRETKATSLKVLDTGIWRCRFRPFKSEPVDIRGRSAGELCEELGKRTKERLAAREAARAARERARREHREAVAKAKAELRELGARGFRVRRADEGYTKAYRWKCWYRNRNANVVTDFDEPSAEALIAAVRRAAEQARNAPGAGS